MPRFMLAHHKAVWETTTVEVDAPDADHVKQHADELIIAALENDTAQIASGDAVEGVADEYEVHDEHGTHLTVTGPTAALLTERPWSVVYHIHYLAEDDRIDVGRVTVQATNEADALKQAVAWAHDNDPRCDERIDYRIEAEVDEQETQEDDDEQNDSPG